MAWPWMAYKTPGVDKCPRQAFSFEVLEVDILHECAAWRYGFDAPIGARLAQGITVVCPDHNRLGMMKGSV